LQCFAMGSPIYFAVSKSTAVEVIHSLIQLELMCQKEQ
jgi:hypothetical protein